MFLSSLSFFVSDPKVTSSGLLIFKKILYSQYFQGKGKSSNWFRQVLSEKGAQIWQPQVKKYFPE
jgi:hypothetical protein